MRILIKFKDVRYNGEKVSLPRIKKIIRDGNCISFVSVDNKKFTYNIDNIKDINGVKDL